jgi:glyoxylase-like metal-dependent hydrolase (beta-lactamase superfamily II)
MLKVTAAAILLVAAAVTVQALQRPQIQTLGEIPDGRKRDRSVDKITEVVRHVQGNVYVVAGVGSNIPFLAGDDGILMVDSQYAEFPPKIVEAIRQVSDKPIRFVINTHSHTDHTGGNEGFAKMGAIVIAHDNARKEMMQPAGANAPPVPKGALPLITYDSQMTFHINGEDVTLIHPPKPSHTTGDTFIYFRGSDVLATGDVYNANYPAVNAGDTKAVLEDWNMAINLIGPNTKIVIGHGQFQTRADLIGLRDAMLTINERIRGMISKGMTYEQVKAAAPTKEFDARFDLERGGRNEARTTEQWLRGYYDTLVKEVKGSN